MSEELRQELQRAYEERDRIQRLLEEEREKSVRYAGQLHDLRLQLVSSEAALFKVIRILGRKE